MICYSIRLLKILPDKADHVVRALRQEGLLAELKKEIPGHIGCSILESDITNDLYSGDRLLGIEIRLLRE